MAGWLAAGLAFAAVFAVIGGGLVLTQGPDVIDQPQSTTAVEPDRPATTAVTLPPTTAAPPSSTSTTANPTTTTTPPTTTTPSTTVPAPATSVLSAMEPAPAGVAELFGPIMGEGDNLCSNNRDDLDYPYSGPPLVRRSVFDGDGIGPSFCVFGFDLDRPMSVEVLAGGSLHRSYLVAPEYEIGGAGLLGDAFAFVWRSLPTDPIGGYEFRATQGATRVAATFEVVPPPRRGLSIEPRTVVAGSPVEIVLSGYPANSEVSVHIYREQAEPAFPPDNALLLDYITTVSVRTDAAGWAVLRIETSTSDPLRGYWVNADPETDYQPSGCICPFAPDVFELVP
jgi:hypothetical protein